jgi:hypothetical protein
MSTTDTTGLPDYAPVPSSGFPPVEVLATAGFALSIVDERKDSAGITSDTYQILPSSNQNIYTLGVSQIDQELGAQMIPGFFLALKSYQDLLKSIIEQLKAKDELG